MNNKKAKSIIVIVLAILVIGCIGFLVWQYIDTPSSENSVDEDINVNKVEQKDESIIEEQENAKLELYETLIMDGNLYLKKYNGTEKEVTVPTTYKGQKVYGITSACYGENTIIEKVIIPDEIESVDRYSFTRCENLKEVILPKNMTEIPTGLFKNCTSLIHVEMPEVVESIGKDVFNGCENLKEIKFKEATFTEIGSCFAYKSGLEKFTVPSSVQQIEPYAFLSCNNLKEVHITDTTILIYSGSFNTGEDLVIYAPKGSQAEAFAKAENIKFIAE